jgi:ABC-2 type transport system ATP-binding protein
MKAIAIQNLTKRFAGKPVLENVTMDVPAGQVVALLGRNGVGKTTLMRILFGLIAPDEGKTEILGLDSRTATVEMRLRTGFMTEECHYYTWMTGHDLVHFLSPMYATWNRELFESLVKSLEIPLDKPMKDLSKGSRRKLMIALTLAPKPEVIMLDEPLAGLDVVVREQILTTIVTTLADQGCSILLSSHELQEVERICDRVVIVSQAKVLLDLDRDLLKTGMKRVLVDLENPMEVVPAGAGIIHGRARGAQLELIVRDLTEEAIRQVLANFKYKSFRTEGLSLQEIFISLTAGKEE